MLQRPSVAPRPLPALCFGHARIIPEFPVGGRDASDSGFPWQGRGGGSTGQPGALFHGASPTAPGSEAAADAARALAKSAGQGASTTTDTTLIPNGCSAAAMASLSRPRGADLIQMYAGAPLPAML